MDSIIETLHYHFVEGPGLDAFPEDTAACRAVLESLPLREADAANQLRLNASITAFREGLRLGLLLGWECGLPAPPLP